MGQEDNCAEGIYYLHRSQFIKKLANLNNTWLLNAFSQTVNAPIGQRNSMSHFDKEKINLMYNCPPEE